MRRWTSFVFCCFCVVVVGATVAPAAGSVTRTPLAGVRSVPVPADAGPVDTSHATDVVGHGTAASCTSASVVAAVRAGGIIRFSCGRNPVTIRMGTTAKVMNTSSQVVLDGGGLVTLSGEGRRRILYMDTCDPAQVWTTPHCQDQSSPELVVQNLGFKDGNSTGDDFDGGGGGAIFARGGRLRMSTRRSTTTTASVMDRTSAAEPSERCRSTTAFPCTSWTAASPEMRAATAGR